ncbi:hypothetical protein [Fodinicurvata halophila]|uniref:hypothetical protein n=1 Tax=Fodinicurvata halophila TaxID=1419723 RepID=UPI00362F8B70
MTYSQIAHRPETGPFDMATGVIGRSGDIRHGTPSALQYSTAEGLLLSEISVLTIAASHCRNCVGSTAPSGPDWPSPMPSRGFWAAGTGLSSGKTALPEKTI